jgi:hypothetical protein
MNSWKYESDAKQLTTLAITKGLNITRTEIYKTLKGFNFHTGIIETKDNKKYTLVLVEI